MSVCARARVRMCASVHVIQQDTSTNTESLWGDLWLHSTQNNDLCVCLCEYESVLERMHVYVYVCMYVCVYVHACR